MRRPKNECRPFSLNCAVRQNDEPRCFSGARLLSLEEYPPFRDVMYVPEGGRNRNLVRAPRSCQELEACFLWHPVGLLGVDLFAGPHRVLPGVLAAPGTRHNVVEGSLVCTQDPSGVLAAVAVTLANAFGTQRSEEHTSELQSLR